MRRLVFLFVLALSLSLVGRAVGGEPPVPDVSPALETENVFDEVDELPDGLTGALGDADDPAIWVHPTKRRLSLVITAVKNGGGRVYDLDGELVQALAPRAEDPVPEDEEDQAGRFNNVDLLYGMPLGGRVVDLAVFTDRGYDTLRVFRINARTGRLRDVTGPYLESLDALPDGRLFGEPLEDQASAYGVALWRNPATGVAYAFVSQRGEARLAQFELVMTDDGLVDVVPEPIRVVEVPDEYEGWEDEEGEPLPEDPQFEGMVVDRVLGIVYAGQEQVGVWRFAADPALPVEPTLIDRVVDFGGPGGPGSVLEADVEGLTIYAGPGTTGYLLVSSQGNDAFAVYDRLTATYLGSFSVGEIAGIDSVQESDGADVVNLRLGHAFPKGLFVTQDGSNDPEHLVDDDGELENVNSNFKFVPWQRIARSFDPPLLMSPNGFDPRLGA